MPDVSVMDDQGRMLAFGTTVYGTTEFDFTDDSPENRQIVIRTLMMFLALAYKRTKQARTSPSGESFNPNPGAFDPSAGLAGFSE